MITYLAGRSLEGFIGSYGDCEQCCSHVGRSALFSCGGTDNSAV